MPLPIAHGLLGAAAVAAIHPSAGRNWRHLLWGVALANAPDIDFALVWLLDWRSAHRGFTHAISSSVIAGCGIWLGFGRAHWREALAYTSALLSHGIIDFATSRYGGGVMLLWPFSTERLKLDLVSFSEHPFGFPPLEVLRSSVAEVLVFAPILLAVIFLRRRSTETN